MNGDATHRLSYIDTATPTAAVFTVEYTKRPDVVEGFNPATGRIVIVIELTREEKI
jgi:hypothetical protein